MLLGSEVHVGRFGATRVAAPMGCPCRSTPRRKIRILAKRHRWRSGRAARHRASAVPTFGGVVDDPDQVAGAVVARRAAREDQSTVALEHHLVPVAVAAEVK